MSHRKAPSDRTMVEAFEKHPHWPDRRFIDEYPDWGVSWKTINRHRRRLMGLRNGGDVSGESRRLGLKGSTRTRIRRVLQDESSWMSTSLVVDAMSERYGDVPSAETVRRTLYRMLEAGQVEMRQRPAKYGPVNEYQYRFVQNSFEGEGRIRCGVCDGALRDHPVGRVCAVLGEVSRRDLANTGPERRDRQR